MIVETTAAQIFLTFCFVCLVALGSCTPLVHHVVKRSLPQLCNLVTMHTQRGCLQWLDYGCFCGAGNAGDNTKPVDKIDKCCRKHDECYGNVTCSFFYPQFVGYQVDCKDSPKRKHMCKCRDSWELNSCERSTCECDVQFARCLGRNKERYNPAFTDYRDKCVQKKVKKDRKPKDRRRRRHLRSRRRKHRKTTTPTLQASQAVLSDEPVKERTVWAIIGNNIKGWWNG